MGIQLTPEVYHRLPLSEVLQTRQQLAVVVI